MSSKESKTPVQDTLLTAFEEMKAVGDEILLPRSVMSDTIKEKEDRSGNGAVVSYLHRYDFGDYFLSVVYTPNRSFLTSAPSTLEVRICLDRSEPLLFLSPYDVIPYLNPSDLICRYFPYVESPERMKSCYRDLVESLLPYLDDFDRIAADREELFKTYNHLRDEMVRCYGENIFLSSGKGEDYDSTMTALRFYHFVTWRSSFFSSQEYAAFLKGDLSSLSLLSSRKFLPDYFKHLLLSIPHLREAPVKAVRSRSASLPAMVDATAKTSTFPILLLTFLLSLPVIGGAFALLYFGVAAIVGAGADYYTALSFSGFLANLSIVILAVLSLVLSSSHIVLRLFFKKRYAAFQPYRAMLKKNPTRSTHGKLKTVILFIAVILVTLSACRGVLFTEDKVVAQQGILPFDSEQYHYSDISFVTEKTDKTGITYFTLHLKNGKEAELVFSESDSVYDNIRSAFDEKGITVYKDGEEPKNQGTTPDTVPDSGKDETIV